MESEKMEAQNGDKWDIVILHSDGQYDLAVAVRDSIRTICSNMGLQARVEMFADLFHLGQIQSNVFDYITENTGVLMFFRSEEFFSLSEGVTSYGLSCALEDRLSHKDERRHRTIIPLDIDTRAKIPGKSSINRLAGLTVTANGDIKDRNKEQKIKRLLDRVRKTPRVVDGDTGLLGQSIAEGLSRQVKEISSLVPSPAVNDTPLITREPTTSDKASTETLPSEVNISGMANPVLEDDRQCQSGPMRERSLPFRCQNTNRPEINATVSTFSTHSTKESSYALYAHSPGTSIPAVNVVVKQVNEIFRDEQDSFDLPYSVIPDNKSFPSRSPSNQCDATEHKETLQFQQHQKALSPGSFRNCSPGTRSQSEYTINSSGLRHYWNQMGARPKTTPMNSSMSTLSHEQYERRPSTNKRQEFSQTLAEIQPGKSRESVPPQVSSNPGTIDGKIVTDSSDAELQNIMDDLRETSLTPPPFANLREVTVNNHRNLECPQNSPFPSQSSVNENFCPAFPREDLQQSGTVTWHRNSGRSEDHLKPADTINNAHCYSNAFHSPHPAEANSAGGRQGQPRRSQLQREVEMEEHSEHERLQYHNQQQQQQGSSMEQEGLADLRASLADGQHSGPRWADWSASTDSGIGTLN